MESHASDKEFSDLLAHQKPPHLNLTNGVQIYSPNQQKQDFAIRIICQPEKVKGYTVVLLLYKETGTQLSNNVQESVYERDCARQHVSNRM